MRRPLKYNLSTLLLGAVGMGLVTTFIMAQNRRQEAASSASKAPAALNRSDWVLEGEDEAIAQALEILGLPEEAELRITAEVVSLADDNTPFLSDQIVGRSLWHVVIHNWHPSLVSAPVEMEDSYRRTFDAYLDPVNGGLLKIVSRWPDGLAPIPPEPGALSCAEQMFRSGNEVYHGFPEGHPAQTFLEALDAVFRGGGNPLVAGQIIGQYVVWSRMEQDPKSVWAITLRGIPPFESAYPGVSVHARDHLRHIVDAETGEWLCANTTPQPEGDAIGP